MICPICQVEFKALRKNQTRCSRKCNSVYQNQMGVERKRIWALQNKSRIRQSQNLWVLKYPEKRKTASRNYQQRNKAYYSAYAANRRVAEVQATPTWADKDTIYNFYKEAEYFGLEIDHIIPIKHPLVCGLHVPENMQLLSRTENARKGNRFEIT